MPLYSRTFSDAEIVDLVRNKYQSVLLAACGGCMNESLAFDHYLPITAYTHENKRHPAIEAECVRISRVLNDIGVSVDTLIFPAGSNSRCIINLCAPQHPILPSDLQGAIYDAILMLSCPSGFTWISRQAYDIPVFNITRQKGMLSYTTNNDNGNINIVNGKISFFNVIDSNFFKL